MLVTTGYRWYGGFGLYPEYTELCWIGRGPPEDEDDDDEEEDDDDGDG